MRWVVVLALAEGVFLKPDKDRMLTFGATSKWAACYHLIAAKLMRLSRWWISTSRLRCWKIKSQKRSSVASLGEKPSELSKQTSFLAKTAVEQFFMKLWIAIWYIHGYHAYASQPSNSSQLHTEDSGGSSKSHPNHTDTGSGSCWGGTGSTKTCGGDGDATEGATGEGSMRAGWLQLQLFCQALLAKAKDYIAQQKESDSWLKRFWRSWYLPVSLIDRKGWAIYLEVRKVPGRLQHMVFKGLCWQNQYGYLSNICYCLLREGTFAIHLFALLGEVCQRQQ